MMRCSKWLKSGGLLFIHIFVHKRYAYHFEVQSEDDWMAKYFFTGGTMPSDHLLLYFQQHLSIVDHWNVNGQNYEKTSNDWLKNMDRNKAKVMPIIAATYGAHQQTKWFVYWRLFFISCAELFGWDKGNEWYVSHYLFEKP
jgi:cyclopropane-fatty-acyl-phospholipid synthase